MADMLHEGLAWLAEEMEEHVSREVIYTRGAYSTTMPATVGATPFRIDSIGQGTSNIVRSERDYLIRAAVLILNGEQVTPKRGDRITDSVDGKVYECQPVVDGEPAWRKSDPMGEMYRIHCTKVT